MLLLQQEGPKRPQIVCYRRGPYPSDEITAVEEEEDIDVSRFNAMLNNSFFIKRLHLRLYTMKTKSTNWAKSRRACRGFALLATFGKQNGSRTTLICFPIGCKTTSFYAPATDRQCRASQAASNRFSTCTPSLATFGLFVSFIHFFYREIFSGHIFTVRSQFCCLRSCKAFYRLHSVRWRRDLVSWRAEYYLCKRQNRFLIFLHRRCRVLRLEHDISHTPMPLAWRWPIV